MLENPETGASRSPLTLITCRQRPRAAPPWVGDISSVEFQPPLDSSAITTEHWVQLARVIEENYDKYDGFVILHGTDTMAYTASALSFVFEGLAKPIVFTGSTAPRGEAPYGREGEPYHGYRDRCSARRSRPPTCA